jgi:hypothetical protein
MDQSRPTSARRSLALRRVAARVQLPRQLTTTLIGCTAGSSRDTGQQDARTRGIEEREAVEAQSPSAESVPGRADASLEPCFAAQTLTSGYRTRSRPRSYRRACQAVRRPRRDIARPAVQGCVTVSV